VVVGFDFHQGLEERLRALPAFGCHTVFSRRSEVRDGAPDSTRRAPAPNRG
jgi:hypothetical protein